MQLNKLINLYFSLFCLPQVRHIHYAHRVYLYRWNSDFIDGQQSKHTNCSVKKWLCTTHEEIKS